MDQQTTAHLAARVDKLEEACAYAERGLEELSQEVKLLNDRVREGTKRIEGLERRIEALAERVMEAGGGGGGGGG